MCVYNFPTSEWDGGNSASEDPYGDAGDDAGVRGECTFPHSERVKKGP